MVLKIIKRNKEFCLIEQIGNKAGQNINVLYKHRDVNKVKEYKEGKLI